MTNLDGYDWSVVGFPGNQLPGDAEVVAQTAGAFKATAAHLSLAARSLRQLGSASDTCSEAVDKIVGKAEEVAGLLDHVYRRYSTSAGALTTYAPVLERAQQQAEQALRGAAQAQRDHDVAHRNMMDAYNQARSSTDPMQREELLQHYYAQKSRTEAAASSVDNARAVILGAIHERDLAAKSAASQISGAIDDKTMNDDLWDHVQETWHEIEDLAKYIYEHDPALKTLVDGIAKAVTWVWDHIDEISLALTVIAFAVSWIPGVGEVALAAALVAKIAAAARVVSIAARVIDTLKLGGDIVHGLRTNDWGPALWRGASFVVGFGAGRAYRGLANRASQKTLEEVRQESLKRTGNLRLILSTHHMDEQLNPVQRVVHYYAGENPLGRMTSAGRSVDDAISALRGGPLESTLQDGVFISRTLDTNAVGEMVSAVGSNGVDVARDAFHVAAQAFTSHGGAR